MNAKLLLVALSCLLASAFSEEIVPTFGVNKQIFYANGTLDFECTDTTVPTTFTPNATLYSDAGYTTPVGTYNVTFAHNDGSFTRTIRTINSTAVAGSISNFLAAALRNNGTGVFDKIAFITRFNTTGGVPVACTAASGIQSVVYSAVYGFYRSGAPTVSTPGATLKTSLRAVGTLNVDCSTGAVSGIESVMYTLADPPVPAGTYNGTFISSDGSFTRASSPTPFNATAGASLTYFLANGLLTNGTGALNGISFITRYDTVGGVCPSGTTSGTVNVPFEASYGFYAAATSSTSSTLSSTGTVRTTTSSASILTFAGALVAVISMLMA